MSVAIRTATRLQDQNDVNVTPSASVDGAVLSYDHDTRLFVLGSRAGVASDEPADATVATDQSAFWFDGSVLRWKARRNGVVAVGAVGGTPMAYRDTFLTALAAGGVNGSAAEPGPGTRVVVDTAGQVAITDAGLVTAGAATDAYNPYVRASYPILRKPGNGGYLRVRASVGKRMPACGLLSASGGYAYGLRRQATWSTNGVNVPIMPTYMLDSHDYDLVFVLRTTGCFLAVNDGSGPKLWYPGNSGTTATLYVGNTAYQAGYDEKAIVPEWGVFGAPILPVPLASDGFTRADGALGFTDGNGHPEQNGGRDKAWTANVGTWEIASSGVAATATDGGKAIATVDVAENEVLVEAAITRTAGEAGLTLLYVDANNYIRAYHDGTNVKLDTVIAGVVLNRVSAAKTYSAGARLVVRLTDVSVTVAYNESPAGTINMTMTALLGSGKHGLYTTDTGNSFDNFVVWPLDWPALAMAAPLQKDTVVWCTGDSISQDGTYTDALQQALGDGWAVVMRGVTGETTVSINLRFQTTVLEHQPRYVVILAGVNDCAQDRTAAGIQAQLQAMYTAAKAIGCTVIAVTITPWQNNASWTSGRQAVTDAVNAWILATATDVDYRIDAYTALEDPAAPDALLAAYDSGDHLHPGAVGYAALGAAIYAGVTWA